ncbi:MAG: hypothetical protein ACJ716_11810 [Marmoricola sp.]
MANRYEVNVLKIYVYDGHWTNALWGPHLGASDDVVCVEPFVDIVESEFTEANKRAWVVRDGVSRWFQQAGQDGWKLLGPPVEKTERGETTIEYWFQRPL